jgi:folate-binding protein YgfZ
VEFEDRTEKTAFWCLAGEEAAQVFARFGNPPTTTMQTATLPIAGSSVLAARVPWLREPAWLLSADAKFAPLVEDTLVAGGANLSNAAHWNSVRIAARLPLYGQDITTENLPQELARDKLAISFTKGCYLGQEPIARIDALGHVNKLLVGLRAVQPITAEVKLPIEVMFEGKTIGKITSLASGESHAADVPTALGIVRRAQAKVGTTVESNVGAFEVV